KLSTITQQQVRRREPISTVPTARALADERLRIQLSAGLNTPGWSAIWLVTPFASDVPDWGLTSNALTSIVAKQVRQGVQVTLITRPPSEGEGLDAKKRLLETLERDGATVLVNETLHAKIYLFEG